MTPIAMPEWGIYELKRNIMRTCWPKPNLKVFATAYASCMESNERPDAKFNQNRTFTPPDDIP